MSTAWLQDVVVPEAPPPELRFQHRLHLLRSLRELWNRREVIRTLTERDLRARYKAAFLGYAWAIVLPFVYMVVFTLFFKRVAKIETGHIPYPLFSYVGLLPWTLFSGSVNGMSTSLSSNMSLLNKVPCPREVFPLSDVGNTIVTTLISTSALVILFFAYGFTPKATSYWVPVLLAVLFMFMLGVGFFFAVVTIYVRDLRQLLGLVLQMGLFATPIAYPFSSLSRELRIVLSVVNPLAPVIDSFRRTVLLGQQPTWLLGLGAASAAVMLVVGYTLFKKLEIWIADYA